MCTIDKQRKHVESHHGSSSGKFKIYVCFLTGDMAYYGKDENIYIQNRTNDIINHKSRQVIKVSSTLKDP